MSVAPLGDSGGRRALGWPLRREEPSWTGQCPYEIGLRGSLRPSFLVRLRQECSHLGRGLSPATCPASALPRDVAEISRRRDPLEKGPKGRS